VIFPTLFFVTDVAEVTLALLTGVGAALLTGIALLIIGCGGIRMALGPPLIPLTTTTLPPIIG
jgi:hypothetical protein